VKKVQIVWSEFQKAIFDDVANGKSGQHTVVMARAGSAKTSSLTECVRYIPKGKRSLFVAFNKKIAETLDEKINKSYCEVRTLHSVGYATVRKRFPKIKLDTEKVEHISANVLRDLGYKQFDKQKFELAYSLTRTINLCHGALIDTPSKIDDLIDRFDIETFEMPRDEFVRATCRTLRECHSMVDCLSFSEMVSWVFTRGLLLEQYDRVFIDEAQDLTPAQLHIALGSCKKDGRILACGDSRQVLYTWAGVDINAIDILTKRLNAKVLPLPISYRCAKSIVKLAQEIVPDIQHAPSAIEGSVEHIFEDDFLDRVKVGDFILSRVNAPLIYYCMRLLLNGTPANIQGKDVGANLAYIIRKSEKKNVPDFLEWLEEWKSSEIARLRSKGRDPILIVDKAACLETLCNGARSLDSVFDNIKTLFHDGDDTARVMLSSVHKAKGLERDRVFLLDWTFRRGMDVSEDNIDYVAKTRAKRELYLVQK
jgi:DNA helicase II / ATP-dependent DNA helicase PcrA